MNSIAKRLQSQVRRSRFAMFSLMIPLAAVSAGLMDSVQPVLRLLYIVLGFSLIIFLHELGHFAVARMCSVKCLAFSIGIGPRACGWRKGGRFSFGADPYDPEAKKPHVSDSDAIHSDLPVTDHIPPHPRSVGDCDYRLSWLPLGGYVRMLGQDDMDPTKQSVDPRSFGRRPIWQRMCIVSAGVIMNLIFAAVCFSIIFSPNIGVDFPPARIGIVTYDSPAWKAGIRPGDEVTKINNDSPRGFLEFSDLQMAAALSNGVDPIHYWVRHSDGRPEGEINVVPVRDPASGLLSIGVQAMPSTRVLEGSEEIKKEVAAAKKAGTPLPVWFTANQAELEKIRKKDKIVSVDGTPVNGDYMKLQEYVQTVNGKAVKLGLANIEKPSLGEISISITPHIEPLQGVGGFPKVLGLEPRLIVGSLQSGYPADKEGVKIEDRITRVGDRTYPNAEEMIDIITSTNGAPIDIEVERDGKPMTFHISPKLASGKFRIGVGPAQDTQGASFIPPKAQSASGDLNLPQDATISKIDGQGVKSWEEIYGVLRGKAPGDVTVTFKTGSAEVSKKLPFTSDEAVAVNQELHYMLGVSLENETRNQHGENAVQAMQMGLDHTKKFILNVYMTLWGLAHRTVDASNLHGIVGITKIGYDVQERGTVWLWYVLAMVSVNLAVANFLPLPIVDGGLFLLLILEKIRGKPLSLKVQTAIQTVGIVLLASLFIFVTYNDITGLFLK